MELNRDPEILAAYLKDESGYTGRADALVRVKTLEDLVEAMRLAGITRTPVTISARRTSLTGAAVPEGGWVLLLPETSSPDLVRIDRQKGTATAPAHVLVSDVEAAATAAGFFLPLDPTSRASASVGGAVACNASGARSYQLGPTGRWVEGLVVVLSTGDVLRLKRGQRPPRDGAFELFLPGAPTRFPCPPPRPKGLKSAVGFGTDHPVPDLLDVFVGSEGTLGVIHEVTFKLLPRQPIFSLLAFFPEEAPLLDFVARLKTAPHLDPMSVEFFDRASLSLAEEALPRLKVPKDAKAALFIEQRHLPGAEEAVATAWYEALVAAGVPDKDDWLRLADGPAAQESFRAFRHAVPEGVNAAARARGMRKLGTDLSYPAGYLHWVFAQYRAAVADLPAAVGPRLAATFKVRHGAPLPASLDAVLFGHIGDTHLHLNLLPKDELEAAAGRLLIETLSRHCLAVGGSLSAEHGIGKSKRRLLHELAPPADLKTLATIKHALDPFAVLGRGNLLELV